MLIIALICAVVTGVIVLRPKKVAHPTTNSTGSVPQSTPITTQPQIELEEPKVDGPELTMENAPKKTMKATKKPKVTKPKNKV